MEGKKKIVLDDPPSCEFVSTSVEDERKAVEEYINESDRTNDPVLKRFFHDIAVEEMKHLNDLESIKEKICKTKIPM